MANGESYRGVALGQGGSAAPPGDVKQAVKPLINDAEAVSLNIALGEPDPPHSRRRIEALGYLGRLIAPMPFVKIAASDFDLEKTLNCGQVFHWLEAFGTGFVGTIGDVAVYVGQEGETL